jgi:RHH-type transcriptional regulator, proline utilization regulon repressor / proline dehydrogenase / delta 1-pyrroline-5-carboxylate dehydrogenase
MQIQAIGEDIFERAKKFVPTVGSKGWRQNQLFNLCMKNEEAARQIFRFLEVFPNLGDDEHAILTHMQEYLVDSNVELGILAPAVKLAKTAPSLAVSQIKKQALEMSWSFIAGETIKQALDTLNGKLFTIDLLGELTTSKVDSMNYQQAYLSALTDLASEFGVNNKDKFGSPRINMSIKLSALYEHFDPIDPQGTSTAVRAMLRPIIQKAISVGAFINIDMEHYQYNALTNKIFHDLVMEKEFKTYPHFGSVVQAVLKDSGRVLEGYIKLSNQRGVPITIRLVKGAYWDHEVMLAGLNGWECPVFKRKGDTDIQYEKLARMLFQNRHDIRGVYGTHSLRSMAAVMQIAKEYEVTEVEFQKLFGVGEEIGAALRDMGYSVREYTPVGERIPGMGYFIRRLLENSSNQAFVRKFDKSTDVKELVHDPMYDVVETEKKSGGLLSRLFKKNEVKKEVHSFVQSSEFTNFPVGNFAIKEVRDGMQHALTSFRFGTHMENSIISVNPARYSETVGYVSELSRDQVQNAIHTAKNNFTTWKNVSPEERATLLQKAANVMSDNIYKLSVLIVKECAKPWREAHGDVAEAIDFLNFYALEMIRLNKERKTQDHVGETNTQFYHPVGVASIIAPWNFPLAILTGMTSAALVTGNTVLVKPSSQSPLIGKALVDILREVGFPEGVVNFVPSNRKDASLLVESPDVDIIAFTGSRNVGTWINNTASQQLPGQKHLKRVIAEMGGKNAMIIDRTADIEQAVLGVVQSAFGYSGQKCSACSRVIVDAKIYDLFIPKLVEAARSLRVGDPSLPSTDVGPVISQSAYDKITGYVNRAKIRCKILLEGIQDCSKGFFIGPTIIEAIRDDELAQEEIFGPVLTVIRSENFDDALAIANGTEYALTGGIYSRTPSHLARVKREFLVGNLYINRTVTGAVVQRQPFGGCNMSGTGPKAGGTNYLLRFLHEKTVSVNETRSGFVPEVQKKVE